MIYFTITVGSAAAYFAHAFWSKRRKIVRNRLYRLIEVPVLWLFIFALYYVKTINKHGYWPGEEKTLSSVAAIAAISAVAAGLLILFHAYFHMKKTDKYGRPCLFVIKGIEILPLKAIVYALTGAFLLISLMFFTENIINAVTKWDKWNADLTVINSMIYEKISDDLEYPLVRLKGQDSDKDADVRILVLGDSFVQGHGSSNINYLWWNQLSRELNARGYDCTVDAVGEGGASTFDQYKWLSETSMIDDLNPDIIIIGYVTNDPEYDPVSGHNYSFWGNYYGSFSQVLDFPLETVFKKYVPTVFTGIDLAITFKFGQLNCVKEKIGYQIADWEQKIVEGDMLNNFNTYVVEPLGQFASSTDIPVILVTTPQSPDMTEYFEPKYAPVLPLFENAGIKTYNLLYDFNKAFSDGRHKDNYSILPVDSHPGTASTYFYARYIADLLEKDYLSILGPKSRTEKQDYEITINDWMPFSLEPKTLLRSSTFAEYTITYPNQKEPCSFLKMPVNLPYVKLNFRYPVLLSSVTVEGHALESATLFVTAVNDEFGFDDRTMFPLGKQGGPVCEWKQADSRRVTSLCIHAKIAGGGSEKLTVKISSEEGGVFP